MADKILVTRQPIVRSDKKIWGYRLSFRCSLVIAPVENDEEKTRRIVQILSSIPFASLVGHRMACIELTEGLLKVDASALFIPEQTVLEIHAAMLTPQLLEQCRPYKEKGFWFAVTDVPLAKIDAAWRGVIDFVKFSVLPYSPTQLTQIAKILARHPYEIIAEHVNKPPEFEACAAGGINLYQGTFYEHASTVAGKAANPARVSVMSLIALLERQAPIDEIEGHFKHHTDLAFKLLTLINSSAFMLRQEVTSIRQAVMLLGYEALKRWSMVLLYSAVDTNYTDSPVYECSSVRAIRMEMLSRTLPGFEAVRENAYFVGMLSSLDLLLELPIDEIVGELGIGQSLKDALLEHKGPLGELLTIAIALERDNPEALDRLLETGKYSLDTLAHIATEAVVVFHRESGIASEATTP